MSTAIRSVAPYKVEVTQADAICRIASYQCKDYDRKTIFCSASQHEFIPSSIALPFQRDPTRYLGSLQRLPLELLQEILLHTDIQTLFCFRQTNLTCRQAVDSLQQYQRAASHGLPLLCALLRTRTAVNTSLLEFDKTLCNEKCATCGNFGGFVSLLTGRRCCALCMPIRTPVRKLHTVSEPKTAQVNSPDPSGRGSPVSYDASRICYHFVSQSQAFQLAQQQARPNANTLPSNKPKASFSDDPIACALPYYNRSSGQLEEGVKCAGCKIVIDKGLAGPDVVIMAIEMAHRAYSRKGFLDHFRWCRQAQNLWEDGDGANSRPAKLMDS